MKKPIQVFLAGDSTVSDCPPHEAPMAGWGQVFGQLFSEDVLVRNHAKGGASTNSFVEEGRLQAIAERITQGDYLLIQFGHNDQKPRGTNRNPLRSKSDVKDWRMEGGGQISFDDHSLHLSHVQDEAHFVFWCPETFPDGIIVTWDFSPIEQPGLCMLFFAAAGISGEDLFDPSLRKRTGTYPEYHSGDINALHLSYFRRKYPEERAFRTCNLRKSRGFHLAAMGADPLPSPDDADSPYRMKLIKDKGYVHFSINGLPILEWMDDGSTYGPVLTKGNIGFRQMAPMKAAYRDFAVHQAVRR